MAAVTAAVIGAGAAVAGVVGARKSSKAAASAQERAASEGQSEIARQFDITQGNLKPFQDAGVSAITEQQALLGLSGDEAQSRAFAQLQDSPGQAFLRKRQERTLLRNASAIGGLGGGNVRTALQEQAVGFAQQDIENQFGRLGQLAGQGRGAATSVGQFGQNAATNRANLGTVGGEARASGIFGRQQAVAQGLSGISNIAGQFAAGRPPPPPPPAVQPQTFSA